MNNTGFSKGDILVPNVECMSAWSVIACDQYTSQPQYWRDAVHIAGTMKPNVRKKKCFKQIALFKELIFNKMMGRVMEYV